MNPLIYTTVYGQRWHYYGDRLINSVREAGYDGDILAICDTAYSPPDGVKVFRLNLDHLDVVDDRPEVSRIWMTRYYIDRLGFDYTDYLYLDADCAIVPGKKIDELLAPGNWLVRDKEVWERSDPWWHEYFGRAIPQKMLDAHPEWFGINSGTFKITAEDLAEFCSGVRGVYHDDPELKADQAALNGYVRCRCRLSWNTYREFLVAFINYFDYDTALRMGSIVVHELGNIKGDTYQCDVFPSHS